MTGLLDLPVELLYEVQLHALSPSLPQVNRHLHIVFSSSPPSFKTQYILRHVSDCTCLLVTIALRFPICSEHVLDIVLPSQTPSKDNRPELPRRLFRNLAPRELPYSEDDPPLPLLRFLFTDPRVPAPDANSHLGYALARAVHAEFIPLIRLLLARGASPRNKSGLAVMIAIRKKKLALVKLLVEREETDELGRPQRNAKKRKMGDRVEITPEMLKTAVKAKARDITEYFMQEKGCIPDIQTLNLLMR
ncbi:hypothetical protein MIND_00248300 [Mycena indigotica]|uniref:Ankyrin n=1 Tax=Mycena indigotica TaxID=2126181 RepID=A0A8H6T8L3_9AGAR|nr:uncharacterized protein MIND_00248300 [Mycena indigotica]KAF7312352.1 hypothetical protein MIND_00248300 [Mycena indigotica]